MIRLLILSILILSTVNSKPCSAKTEKELGCCVGSKSLSCLFKSIDIQTTNDTCNCLPRHMHRPSEFGELCQWNSYYQSNMSRSVGCNGFAKKCEQPAINDDNFSICSIARKGKYLYPPRGKDYNYDQAKYCSLKKNDGTKLTNFYEMMLTCWLFECEMRLSIPKKTLEMWKKNEKDYYRWCLPPTLHASAKLKYCPLYETVRSVYTEQTDEEFEPPKDNSSVPCILPPICGSDRTVDTSRSMIPLVGGEVKDNYCENLCSAAKNSGKDDNGNACRVRPSCNTNGREPDPKYNKYKVENVIDGPACLPWCSDSDSRIKDPEKRTQRCNNWPICETIDGNPNLLNASDVHYLPYSGKMNLYGAETCHKILKCTDTQAPETHFCYLEGSAPTEPPINAPVVTTTEETSLPVSANVGIVVCIVGLLVIVLIIGGVFLWRRKKTKRYPDEFTENNLAQGGEAAMNDSHARPAKSSKNRKKTSKSATAVTPTSPATKPGGQTPSEGLYEDYSPTGKQGDQVPIATPSTDKV